MEALILIYSVSGYSGASFRSIRGLDLEGIHSSSSFQIVGKLVPVHPMEQLLVPDLGYFR